MSGVLGSGASRVGHGHGISNHDKDALKFASFKAAIQNAVSQHDGPHYPTPQELKYGQAVGRDQAQQNQHRKEDPRSAV